MITELHYNHMTVPQCLLPLRDITQNWNLKFFIQSNKIRHNCSKDNLWPTTRFTCQINQSFRISNNIEKALSKYWSVPDVYPNWEKQLQLINVFVVLGLWVPLICTFKCKEATNSKSNMETLHGRHHYTADQNKGSPLTLRRDQDQVSPYNITPQILSLWEQRKWAPIKAVLDWNTNSLCPWLKECIENSMENKHTDIGV